MFIVSFGTEYTGILEPYKVCLAFEQTGVLGTKRQNELTGAIKGNTEMIKYHKSYCTEIQLTSTSPGVRERLVGGGRGRYSCVFIIYTLSGQSHTSTMYCILVFASFSLPNLSC